MSCSTRITCGVALLGALTSFAPIDADAQDRLARRITSSGDIVLGGVRSLAQDSVGFIWLGTNDGLLRWDGIELRRWARDHLDSWINYMTVCPDGSLYVVEEGGTLFEISANGAVAVPRAAGERPPLHYRRTARARCPGAHRSYPVAYRDGQTRSPRARRAATASTRADSVRRHAAAHPRPGIVPGRPRSRTSQAADRGDRPWDRLAAPRQHGVGDLRSLPRGRAAGRARHRARLAVALRLERQRSQISLDLHDEMGSGLGSIGILSGVLTGEGLSAQERQRLATKIGDIAGELGASLSDIVWSLRPHTNTLEDVAARLAEHGARLFSGDTARFEARFPEQWPEMSLGFSVSRAVLLIGLEALYNAARHSQARLVTLTVTSEGRAWALAVQDDGRGLPENGEPAGSGSGLGRTSMRRRAEGIGGELIWETVPGGGTRVTLRIVPRRRLTGERLT
jgi:signal transduction histidine kinase